MGENKINITSTVVEKGIDGAKNFLGKLIGPSVEEVGLLIADPIRAFRFRNQIKILSKAEKLVSEQNIKIKKISLKNLVPLLEYSSLEEDENLSDMWVNLLVSYIDAEKSHTSFVFPYILSQLSSKEAEQLLKFNRTNYIKYDNITLSDSELSNLIRLGLVIVDTDYNNNTKGYLRAISRGKSFFSIDDFYFTALGKDFIQCCTRD